jgi:hypothetical protein
MQVPGRQRIEVVINGNQKATNGSTVGRLRPLSVDEALQYSPLTTSMTSGYGTSHEPGLSVLRLTIFSERIPVPDLGQLHRSSTLLTENERTSMEKLLTQSTNTFSNGITTNAQVEVLGRGLNDLLDPDDLSEL